MSILTRCPTTSILLPERRQVFKKRNEGPSLRIVIFYLLPAESQAKELHHTAVLCLLGLLLETSQLFVQLFHSQTTRLPCHEPSEKKTLLQGMRKTQDSSPETPNDFTGCQLPLGRAQSWADTLTLRLVFLFYLLLQKQSAAALGTPRA